MEKNKLIIIALLVIIVALLVGIFATMPNFSKADSQLEIIGNDTLNEGDNLQVKLTDVNGTALSNQTVNITITDENKTSEYHSVITNDDGVGELKLEKDAGKYDVTVIYAGNDGYNGCNTTKKITINEEVVKAQQSTTSSSSQDAIFYDSRYNVFYDSNGIIVDPDGKHPQNVGKSYQEMLDHANQGMGD